MENYYIPRSCKPTGISQCRLTHNTHHLFMRYLVQDTNQGRTSRKMLLFGQGGWLGRNPLPYHMYRVDTWTGLWGARYVLFKLEGGKGCDTA